MRLLSLELESFRNIPAAQLSFEGPRHFFLGPNAQGKTNLLEAIAFVVSARSFRTHQRAPLISQGAPRTVLRATFDHEKLHATSVGLCLSADSLELRHDQKTLRSPRELAGLFPVVPLSLADRALIYDGPSARRDEIDSLLAQLHPPYAEALAGYMEALRSRNRILGRDSTLSAADHAQLDAFEAQLLSEASTLIRFRTRATELLSAALPSVYARFAPSDEAPSFIYTPSTPLDTLAEKWRTGRAKENLVGHTLYGPQRDSFELLLSGHPASAYASEGQKFSLVLALKLASLQILREKLSLAPLLLADDLLLELDRTRQEHFWGSLEGLQIFATGTALPPSGASWQIWNVKNGTFELVK